MDDLKHNRNLDFRFHVFDRLNFNRFLVFLKVLKLTNLEI